ncbi:uncharacterized protein V1518DRAFT_413481 [Limtongia smithiae]|uniref:uncharacterized protein n=1 Tax=Limtongia smithiae TaxID=1125753 RepID=UPI0034CEED51
MVPYVHSPLVAMVPSIKPPRYTPNALVYKEFSSKRAPPKSAKPLSLKFLIESPPLICYGPPAQSTGALLSGLLFLDVADSLPMKSVVLELIQEITVGAPAIPHCKECHKRVNVLKRWNLLNSEVVLAPSEYGYPFSYLFAGDMPSSTASSIVNIIYYIKATAVARAPEVLPVNIIKNLPVLRSIVSTDIRRSVRVFPPTQLQVIASMPTFCFPRSNFTMDIEVSNINNKEKKTRWILRKFNWRIDEITKIKDVACTTHDAEQKPPIALDVRTIVGRDVRKGWKTDFSNDGRIEMELEVSTFSDDRIAMSCDTADPKIGFSVEHAFVLEMLVGEEYMPVLNNYSASPTGAARILRMQFAIEITERGGLGISWDDEVPPTYEDIPVSPPGYNHLMGREVEDLVIEGI